MIGFRQRHDVEGFLHPFQAFIKERSKRGRLIGVLGPQQDEIRTGWLDLVLQQTVDRTEIRLVIGGQAAGAEMEVRKNDSNVGARWKFHFFRKMYRERCDATSVQAPHQTVQVRSFVVDDDDSRRREHQLPALKIMATTAPSHSSGTSTSPRCGNASLPPFSSIARFA